MPTQPNIRLGIVGCGEHSHVHAAAASELFDVEIVCACDVDTNKAQAWVARHGGEAGYGSIETMLKHQNLDGVILCTWPNQHAEQIRICISSGIRNILCEKALVTSAAEAKLVQGLALQHGANVVEASMHRHHPAIRKLERILASGDIGAIDSVRAAFHNYEPAVGADSATSNWRQRADCGGGVPYDWMHYLVDTCNHFNCSMPKRVFATGNEDTESQVIYRVYGMIEYENGGIGIIENSKLANFSNALQITCANGILHLPIAWAIQGEVTITQTHRKPDWDFILEDTYQIAKTNAYVLQLEDFCRVVRGTGTPLVPLHDSIVNAMTTEALVKSLRQRRAINVEAPDL
jgi:predicted dehydrogenase